MWASSQLAAMRLMRIMDTLASGSRSDVDHMDNEESIKRYLTSFNVGTGRSSIAEELPNQAFLDMPDPDYMPPSLFFHAPANFLPEETMAPPNTEVVSTHARTLTTCWLLRSNKNHDNHVEISISQSTMNSPVPVRFFFLPNPALPDACR